MDAKQVINREHAKKKESKERTSGSKLLLLRQLEAESGCEVPRYAEESFRTKQDKAMYVYTCTYILSEAPGNILSEITVRISHASITNSPCHKISVSYRANQISCDQQPGVSSTRTQTRRKVPQAQAVNLEPVFILVFIRVRMYDGDA